MMEFINKLGDVLMKVASLEARIEDALAAARRLEDKLDGISNRLTKLEVEHQSLRNNVKTEILGEIRADMAVFQERMRTYELTPISGKRLVENTK